MEPIQEIISIWADVNKESSTITEMSEQGYLDQIDFCDKVIEQCKTLGFHDVVPDVIAYKSKLNYYLQGNP